MPWRILLIALAGLVIGSAASLGLLQVGRSGGTSSRDSSAEASGGQTTPARIVCMSPAVTEMVYELQQGNRVVGRSQFTAYPPKAREKPSCGGFINPNTEKILSLEPDLIITQGVGQKLRRFSRKHNARLVSVELTDLESIFQAIRHIGEVLGCEARAEMVTARMRMELAEVKVRASGKPRRRVLLVVGREPGSLNSLNTAGGDSYLDDLLRAAGGTNLFGKLEDRYRQVSKETVARRKPEVIVELRGKGMVSSQKVERIKHDWHRGMPFLPAVRNDRVHVIKSSYALIPGPRVVELAQKLADLIQNEGDE